MTLWNRGCNLCLALGHVLLLPLVCTTATMGRESILDNLDNYSTERSVFLLVAQRSDAAYSEHN